MIARQATETRNDRSLKPSRAVCMERAPRPSPPGVPEVGEPWSWESFEAASFPVHILTEQGLIVEANHAFEELFGAVRGQFVGRHQAVLNNASVAANLRQWGQIRTETSAHGLWRGALRNRRCDGSEFTSLAHVYPMRAAGRRYLVCFQQALADYGTASVSEREPMTL